MNIALCTDENFVVPCLTCITSILENNKDTEIHVYVLTEGLSEKSYTKFYRLSSVYSQSIEVRNIKADSLKGLKVRPPFPVSMYFRFLLPELLPNEEKVLYLDCDIIVRHSLTKLYETDLTDKACSAVIDQHCDDVLIKNNVRTNSPYFNSGVLLMNLSFWRQHNITKKLIDFIYHNPERCLYPDQDALNIVLDGKVTYVNPTFNYQHYWTVSFHLSKTHYSNHPSIKEAGKNPIVVHFCTQKPWHVRCYNPYKKEFYRYSKMHQFIGEAMPNRLFRTFMYKFLNYISLWAENFKYRFN